MIKLWLMFCDFWMLAKLEAVAVDLWVRLYGELAGTWKVLRGERKYGGVIYNEDKSVSVLRLRI